MELGHLTLRLLEQGLRAGDLRQRVLARNIANADTPGYQASHVSFESQLQDARQAGGQAALAVQPQVVRDVSAGREDGNNVDIEAEMVRLAENQIWYGALTRLTGDELGRLRIVISDGRR